MVHPDYVPSSHDSFARHFNPTPSTNLEMYVNNSRTSSRKSVRESVRDLGESERERQGVHQFTSLALRKAIHELETS